MVESVEKATTGTEAGLATEPAATTACANTGPRISWAPSASAAVVAARAPLGVPRSSLIRIWMLALGYSRRARAAAFRMSLPSCAALPVADSGSSSATLVVPVPSTSPAAGGSASWRVGTSIELQAARARVANAATRPCPGGAGRDLEFSQMILPGSAKTG